MKKILDVIYIVCFLMIMLVPLALTNVEKDVVSEIDNRVLQGAPKLGEEEYTKKFEAYLQDRIGLRNQMVNGYAALNDFAVNELTHPNYTYGQDGYIFFNMHDNISYGDFHKTFAEMVFKMQEYCRARGSKFYFMFEPEKTSVLRRYIPKGVNYNDSWVDEMLAYMNQLGVNCVDNTELLIEKSYTEDVFNKKFDAGHWNDLGCFYGTNHLLNKIHEDIPAVTELSKEQFNITTKTETKLPVSEFKIKEKVPSFELKTGYKDITEDYVSEVEVNPNYRHFHYYINGADGAEELPKVLFFQGSYYNRGPQFLISRTSEDIGVHNYQNCLDLDYYYNIFQPEVVIFEVAEYTFFDAYFDSAKMKALDFNPAIIDYSSNISFESQVENLKKNADLFKVNSYISLLKGNKIDKVIVDRKFSDARYAYLVMDDFVIDLKINDEGFLYADLESNKITKGDNVVVYLEDYDGKKRYVPLTVVIPECFTEKLSASEGAEISDNTCTLTTNVQGNKFDQVVLQLYSPETGEYMGIVNSSNSVGNIKGAYIHNGESGWYTLRLKANSNMRDEYVECLVYLINGRVYHYSYNIDKLTENKVEFSGFEFYGYNGKIG